MLNQDVREFSFHLSDLEDMANLLLQPRGKQPVGKYWARRFIDAQSSLKTKFNRPYDYQRALNENPTVISSWFRLLRNIIAKYGIQIENLYNFNETGFMINIITSSLVITRLNRHGKAKSIQPGNRK